MFENVALEFKLLGLHEVLDPEDQLSVDGAGLPTDSVFDPVAKFFEQVQDPALAKFVDGWDEQIGKPLGKREDTDARKLWKSIVRVERVTDQDGDAWANGYDAAGRLIDSRLLIGAE
jgi:YD repeat-containing protein